MLIRIAVLGVLAALAAGCSRGSSEPSSVAEIAAPAAPAGEEVPLAVNEGDWPWWRGPTVNGLAAEQRVPTTWSATQNVIWSAEVPGRGHSTPSVAGERIFVATADEEEQVQYLACYDRASGGQRWLAPVHRSGFEHAHRKNTQASATPACDGERVFITYLNRAAIWVSALDLDGNIVWQVEAGPFATMHGYAASPALYRSLVIVAGDSEGKSFLAGLDRKTGEIVWRVKRPGGSSFASPIVAHVAGRDHVLISGCDITAGYDPATGKLLWQCAGPTTTVSGTMAFDGDLVFASGGFPGSQTMCVRADGAGDVTATHLVWKNSKNCYTPSLAVHEGLLYGVTDQGIAYCYEAATGEEVWQKRLGGNFSASPIVAGGHIYVPDEAGRTHVFKTGRQYEPVAINELGEGGFASPVICGGQIYLRTSSRLYCIGEASQQQK